MIFGVIESVAIFGPNLDASNIPNKTQRQKNVEINR